MLSVIMGFIRKYIGSVTALCLAMGIVYGASAAVSAGLALGLNQTMAEYAGVAFTNANIFMSSACWLIAKICGIVVMIATTCYIFINVCRKVWYGW